MNTTLFNPYMRICRSAEETPGGGAPAPQQSEGEPPAQPPAPAPGQEQPAPSPQDPQGQAPPEEEEIDFSLEPPPPGEEQEPGDPGDPGDPEEQQEPEPEKTYELELEENLDVTDEFKATLKQHAQSSGLEGKAAGQFVSGVIKSMQEAEQANIAATTRELREDWGRNFNANMKSVKEFAAKLREKSGLTAQDLAPLQSPKGYRLLYSLMKSVGEDQFVSGEQAGEQNPQQEAQRMLTDPSHRYFNAIQDPTDPLFQEANREYNRLVGYPQ